MRIVDAETGKNYVEKRRVRFNEPGQPRALTFSCYRHQASLRNITSIEALRAVMDSMHAHPVRRGLVARVEDGEWSSARWYAGLRPVKLEMTESVLTELARG